MKFLLDAVRQLLPPPNLKISEWADTYRYLSPEASAEHGRWRTSRTPYLREILDAINDPHIEEIIVMSSAQVGKTELLLNIIGYYIHQDPSPILSLNPTIEMAKTFSTDRLAPMLRDSPCFKGLLAKPRSRDGANTLLHKSFTGGHITLAGANSPASLASRPIRIVLADEPDRYPPSAGTEGDPLTLAKKRTDTFHNRKIIIPSTPTISGLSRIEKAFENSDKRHYYVPCPHCGHMHTLSWGNVKFEEDDPDTARLMCPKCKAEFGDHDKDNFLARGEWRASSKSRKTAGFYINALYSPWKPLADIVDEYLRAKDDLELFKAWTNLTLGLPFEEPTEVVDPESLYSRREQYPKNALPVGVSVLTAGVDIQKDRFEVSVWGWGAEEESFLIEHEIIAADPSMVDDWKLLDDYLKTTFVHDSGAVLSISATAIDSGYLTGRVYDFVKGKAARRIYATKGMQEVGRPIVSAPKKSRTGKNPQAAQVYTIGVDEAKVLIFSRFLIEIAGAGYVHLPNTVDKDFCSQLAAEKSVIKMHNGVPKRRWVKIQERNEALDCYVLSYAALRILRPTFEMPKTDRPQQQKIESKSKYGSKMGWNSR